MLTEEEEENQNEEELETKSRETQAEVDSLEKQLLLEKKEQLKTKEEQKEHLAEKLAQFRKQNLANRLRLQELQVQQKEKEETQLDDKAYTQMHCIQIEKFWGKEENVAHQQATAAIEVDYIQTEERNKSTLKTVYEKETTVAEQEKK